MARSNGTSGTSAASFGSLYNKKYSSYLNDEPMPDAASEKEQGNEYFKQKKFAEAIECYSRSIGLSPTAVAYANRAMAYLKLRRQVIRRLYAFTSAYIYSFLMLLLQVIHLS